MDETGHVIVNEWMETSVPGIFAAGDVRSDAARQVVSSAGDGATAAIRADQYISENFGAWTPRLSDMLREWMGPGGSRGLQNRCGAACAVPGGFDSHPLPPLLESENGGLEGHFARNPPSMCLIRLAFADHLPPSRSDGS